MPEADRPVNAAHATICRVITRLNIGGPSIQAARLTTAMAARGFDTRLIHGRLGNGEGDMSYLVAPNADTRYLPALCRELSPFDDVRALISLYREYRRARPSIVHTHMAKAGLLGRVAAAAYNLTRGAAPRARVVHTYHGHVLDGYFGPRLTAFFIALERILARITDTIIAISPEIRTELFEHYRIGKSRQYCVVALGFDLDGFAGIDDGARARARHELGVPDGSLVITTVGRITAIKQHQVFLDAFKLVTERHGDAIALIVGDGELRSQIEAHAAAIGVASQVRFLGWRRDLATIYGATDVFLLTSRNEGTPVALIEAMASGVVGVSTDVGGVKDVIDSPAVGVRVPLGDTAALAAGVESLLADPARRRQMGELARARVLARYGFDRLVNEIAAVYGEMLEER